MEKFIEINKRGIVIIFLEERYRCKEFVEIPAYFSSAFIIREDVFFALHIGSALVLCVYDWTIGDDHARAMVAMCHFVLFD